ncbi:hypothetical protein BDY21DRAFT_142601 [Lineolata rhizophorae]|uniref:NmrA-like domain-containing protein n=1 Tax=Lineolata rhizophorae TaxID=578093 RepID=A0A6A6NNE4_9PEZI|nr:hypothetical protein BDY21DRAFT_142601 [Lineolata rhizophorae]
MSTPKYLVTGATGGLGRSVTHHLLSLIPPSSLYITSSSPTPPPSLAPFLSAGANFRSANFNSLESMRSAFADINKVFIVSVNSWDSEMRMRMHFNAVQAAKEAGVEQVWYSSLALGSGSDGKGSGEGDRRVADVMKAHVETETMLKESGVTYTAIREGVYGDAFPTFLGWYPTDPNQTIYLPADGNVPMVPREELGEATAKLMVQGGHENEIVLLTGPKAHSLAAIVDTINKTTGRNVLIRHVNLDEYVMFGTADDEGGKPEAFFRAWSTFYSSIAAGDGSVVDPLMEEVLGRKPTDALEFIAQALKENPNYTWHQNYANRGAN